jgi:hypothetical protein
MSAYETRPSALKEKVPPKFAGSKGGDFKAPVSHVLGAPVSFSVFGTGTNRREPSGKGYDDTIMAEIKITSKCKWADLVESQNPPWLFSRSQTPQTLQIHPRQNCSLSPEKLAKMQR